MGDALERLLYSLTLTFGFGFVAYTARRRGANPLSKGLLALGVLVISYPIVGWLFDVNDFDEDLILPVVWVVAALTLWGMYRRFPSVEQSAEKKALPAETSEHTDPRFTAQAVRWRWAVIIFFFLCLGSIVGLLELVRLS